MLARNAAAEEIAGPARVLDANRLVLEGHLVRLQGMDAPDTTQRCYTESSAWLCGEEAKARLGDLVRDRAVACVVSGEGLRLSGRCEADGVDLAWAMIESGFALAVSDAPESYRQAQAEARTAALGLWRGSFTDPAEWRKNASCSCELRKKTLAYPLERREAEEAEEMRP